MFFTRHRKFTQREQDRYVKNRRVHLANERTFLAWIRTAISIMAFGIVVDKFTMFSHSIIHGKKAMMQGAQGSSLVMEGIGTAIVLLGALTGIMAAIRFVRLERDIERDEFRPAIVLDLLFVAIFLAIIAFFLINLFDNSLITAISN